MTLYLGVGVFELGLGLSVDVLPVWVVVTERPIPFLASSPRVANAHDSIPGAVGRASNLNHVQYTIGVALHDLLGAVRVVSVTLLRAPKMGRAAFDDVQEVLPQRVLAFGAWNDIQT